MSTRHSTSIGVLVSLALHAGFVATLVRFGDRWMSPSSLSVPAETPLLLPIPPEPAPDPEPPESPDPLKLGIDEGTAQSDTWLGFKEPTPHAGPASTRDQAQMVLEAPSEPAQAVEDQPPSPPTPPEQPQADQPQPEPNPEPNPEPSQATQEPEAGQESPKPAPQPKPVAEDTRPATLEPAETVAPAESAIVPADVKAERPEPGEPLVPVPAPEPATPEAAAPELPVPTPTPETTRERSPDAQPDIQPDAKPRAEPDAKPLVARDDPEVERPKADAVEPASPTVALVGPPVPSPQDLAEREQSEREQAERIEREAAQASQPSPPRHGARPSPARPPGRVSDRESDAAAVRSAINVDPNGGPAATKGLKINTVRPAWSTTTRLVALPRNPVVRVRFNRVGKVVDAAFVDRYDTGWPDVDGPLLDAIYRWKAEGERLRELPGDDPEAVITVTFRITLRSGP
ncbi:MAG: hypothetical protein JNL50_07305 [Phycisphaerae bacterium]|nr:hypothetical protein [Phycisphaerae bacterium]